MFFFEQIERVYLYPKLNRSWFQASNSCLTIHHGFALCPWCTFLFVTACCSTIIFMLWTKICRVQCLLEQLDNQGLSLHVLIGFLRSCPFTSLIFSTSMFRKRNVEICLYNKCAGINSRSFQNVSIFVTIFTNVLFENVTEVYFKHPPYQYAR